MSGGDGYLTNALYREIAKMMTDAGIPHRVEQGAKHFHVKFEHLGVERTQILHLGPNNKGSTRRKTIIRFRKIVEAERAWREQQTSPQLELEQPAMSAPEPSSQSPVPYRAIVTLKDGRPCANSRDIAEAFGRRHDNVLRDIDGLDCSPEFRSLNFEETFEVKEIGTSRRSVRSFNMTRDGFVFLVSGFTGKTAGAFKESWIGAFNEMEEEVRRLSRPTVTSIDSASMKATAQLAGSSAGGAAKNAIVSVRNRIDGLDDRLTDQAKWMQAANRDMHAKMDRLMILMDGASAVALQALDMIEVGSVYEIAGVLGPIRSRTILTTNIKRGLDEWCIDHSIPMHNARVSGRRIRHWPKAAVADWLAAEGHALIARHLRATAPSAQLLPFTKSSEGGA